jgi:hypothetical protein
MLYMQTCSCSSAELDWNDSTTTFVAYSLIAGDG